MANDATMEGKIQALKLARAVLEASRAGRIEWDQERDKDSVFTILAGRALTVRSDDADASHPFTLWVAEQGNILETVNTLDDSDLEYLDEAMPGWRDMIAELYAEGRKRNVRLFSVIDEMLADLNRKTSGD
jgi:hypothetical protein